MENWTLGLHPLAAETDMGGAKTARRSWKRHKAIVDAAIACVARTGYTATTVEAVAAEAGAGKQTIYRWWPSKAALFVEVYGRLADRSILQPSAAPAPPAQSLEEALAALLSRLFDLYRTSPAGAILAGLIGEAAGDEEVRAAVQAGLVLGRGDIVRELVASHPDVKSRAIRPDIVNEVVIALVWKALILAPESLTDAGARAIAGTALSAAMPHA
ncbi:TetR/AcrR family transcriptional regulator [Rhodospirillaceae bacterium KN72]|uniref:TetR/AcrR family transcriptional regulator n=1 Tax=Pacificispira spongiicola TaxID=2729598 RepID=A0A7Y0E1J9_9PROT|nr:TetR/AcrR family transcriptional regulator [Pacificispira spongiicola]NMM45542.1 TetR/AcrR family transcriptional regulator [Pacificispira spongiicola]